MQDAPHLAQNLHTTADALGKACDRVGTIRRMTQGTTTPKPIAFLTSVLDCL